ncbi:2,3-phosphoglycerate synthetase [Pyrococcus yayanosii]|uniref:Cyclic 2,3-diphosphoglycerate synthetase n=1 Tax=Pyrococcus yayanosii (strain CH1 / JCM 16557) TaxID=529709 RepID=F8AJG1_PYRYC|nr:2,3-phosphoglycerate synthetase [Pyrococcus yayanosii]AEH25110.1 cyclic 2,3-diphospoglycerate-synthetase [Pyrococcus yayanosii CH1]
MRLVLIDGEHYPDVIRWALEKVGACCAVFVGGMEKIGGIEDIERVLGIPVYHDRDYLRAIERAVRENGVTEVIDLSDDPVLTPEDRFRIASLLLRMGVVYKGADFEFRPKEWKRLDIPSLAVIGTGKRVGKTAVSGFIARTLKELYRVVVVTMGRGGPEKPELIRGDEMKITPEFLLEVAEKGRHAASDHFEDALMAGVPTVGCRRCGGGLAGFSFLDIVEEGIRVAKTLNPQLIILEGSGGTFPNVMADAFIVVVSALQGVESVKSYFGPFRISLADLVVITIADAVPKEKLEELKGVIGRINPQADVHLTRFTPRLIGKVEGRAVVITTSPRAAERVAKELGERGIEIVGWSGSLANRAQLRKEMMDFPQYETVIVELKAAAVDVVVREVLRAGKKVVFLDNEPVNMDGKDLAGAVRELARRVVG